MKPYDGKIAVVTGASSGIGRRIALDLAARGAVVVGLARREVLLDEVRAELQRSTRASETFVCDVRDTKYLRACSAEVEQRHNRIDILINDARVHEATSVSDEGSFDACERLMATNYFRGRGWNARRHLGHGATPQRLHRQRFLGLGASARGPWRWLRRDQGGGVGLH
jgi:NAD(P)-dependent dehydrogenase (short-subunit alcohol dehydrogenase family)